MYLIYTERCNERDDWKEPIGICQTEEEAKAVLATVNSFLSNLDLPEVKFESFKHEGKEELIRQMHNERQAIMDRRRKALNEIKEWPYNLGSVLRPMVEWENYRPEQGLMYEQIRLF